MKKTPEQINKLVNAIQEILVEFNDEGEELDLDRIADIISATIKLWDF